MRCIAICLGVLFIGCAEAYSAPPVPVLRLVVNDEAFELPDHESPIKVIAGDKVVFDLSTSEGADRYFVMLDNRRPGQRELITRDKWQHSELRSRAGEYQLRFIVSNDEATVELRRTVQVLCKEPTLPDEPTPPPPQPQPPKPTPAPMPAPQPPPVKPVDPPKPDPPAPPSEPQPGRFNVAPEVFRLAKQINDPAGAKALAAQCRAIASGNYSSLNALAADVVATLGKLSPAWQPLTSKVKSAIASLYSEGKLQNRDDAAELLREVAGALEAAGRG